MAQKRTQPTDSTAPRNSSPQAALEEASHKGGGGESAFFFFFGFLLTAFGTALSFAPEFSWRLTRIGQELASMGVQNGVLVVGGLILFGMGLLARQGGRRGPAVVAQTVKEDTSVKEDEEFQLLVDQMTTRLGQLRTSILQIAEDLAGVAEGQQVFFQKQESARTAQAQSQSGPQDGLFRLAASLDKLNAYVDERIHGLDLQLRSGLDSVVHAVHQTRHSLEHRLGTTPAPAAEPAEATFGQNSPELDLQVLVDLEQPAPATPAVPPTPAPAPAPDPASDFFQAMEQMEHGMGAGPASGQAAGPLGGAEPLSGTSGLDPLDALLPDDPMPPR